MLIILFGSCAVAPSPLESSRMYPSIVSNGPGFKIFLFSTDTSQSKKSLGVTSAAAPYLLPLPVSVPPCVTKNYTCA
eukprot:7654396-Ditylum_brightwellii.AAC.1